jgi:predicted dinucleotide-binding enzyme
MKYGIIGFGPVGQALAKMFARRGIEVAVATTRTPEAIALAAREIGPAVVPSSLKDALAADIILLAVPFWAHRDVAKAASDWRGKTIVDVTNSYGISPEELSHLPSSALIAKAFAGAELVKAFNHLPAEMLAQDPAAGGMRRVIFLSSDDEGAIALVATLVGQLGFAPINLGGLSEGGQLIQARGTMWAPLIFQDLFKRGN